MPRPSPNGISTPMIELRSRARAPSKPMISGRDERADDGPRHHADAEQQGGGRARERQLADAVHGERQVALHHEDADQPADDAEHGAGEDRVLQQHEQLAVVAEVEDRVPDVGPVHARPRVAVVVLVVVVRLLGVGRADDDDAAAGADHVDRGAVQLAQHLGVAAPRRVCRAEPAAGEVEHAVDHAEHRVDVVGDEQHGGAASRGGAGRSARRPPAGARGRGSRAARRRAAAADRRRAPGRPAAAAARRPRAVPTGRSA